MKKNTSRKLQLNKETVRKLNDAELRQVAGGATGICDTKRTACCPCTHTSAGPSHPIFC